MSELPDWIIAAFCCLLVSSVAVSWWQGWWIVLGLSLVPWLAGAVFLWAFGVNPLRAATWPVWVPLAIWHQ